MTLIDTHAHLYDGAFDADRAEVIARAEEAGIARMMCPAVDSGSHERLFGLCSDYPDRCLPMMGLHPTSVNGNPGWRDELELVEKYLAAPPVERFYAVGEVGLDLYWSVDWLREQEEAFERQIRLSLEYGLPLVVHTREAWPQMRVMLGKFAGCGLKGVMHSFSGTPEDYHAIKGSGDFLFGIGGPVTYKNSALAETVRDIPLEDIVLETDAPYLPPVPYRGKRNESGYVTYVCERIAEIKGSTAGEIARVTTANAERMFGFYL